MRSSSFEGCDFTRAILDGAVLHRDQEALIPLTPERAATVAWTTESGEPPLGG